MVGSSSAISTAGNATGSSGSCGRAYGTSCPALSWCDYASIEEGHEVFEATGFGVMLRV